MPNGIQGLQLFLAVWPNGVACFLVEGEGAVSMQRGGVNEIVSTELDVKLCNHRWSHGAKCPLPLMFYPKSGTSNYIGGFTFHHSNFKSYSLRNTEEVNVSFIEDFRVIMSWILPYFT